MTRLNLAEPGLCPDDSLGLDVEHRPEPLADDLSLRPALLESFEPEGLGLIRVKPNGHADHAGLRDGRLASSRAQALFFHVRRNTREAASTARRLYS